MRTPPFRVHRRLVERRRRRRRAHPGHLLYTPPSVGRSGRAWAEKLRQPETEIDPRPPPHVTCHFTRRACSRVHVLTCLLARVASPSPFPFRHRTLPSPCPPQQSQSQSSLSKSTTTTPPWAQPSSQHAQPQDSSTSPTTASTQTWSTPSSRLVGHSSLKTERAWRR